MVSQKLTLFYIKMARKKTILDKVYEQYKEYSNMNLSEYKRWIKTNISKKVSKSKKAIYMTIRLKTKPKHRWALTEVKWALKNAIPYIKKAKKKIRITKDKKSMTKRQAILKNWGYNVKKRRNR